MIKIQRCECPNILGDSPSEGDKYRCKKVVQKLWKMQYHKCCYCEQMIPSEGHSKAVEHFKPKSIFKYLRNDWKNLLLVCPQCNGGKLNRFPVELTEESGETKVVYIKTESDAKPLIIDPSNPGIDPEEHIDFIVDDADDVYGLITARDNSKLGQLTIEVVRLDNEFYTDKRRHYYFNTLMLGYRNLLEARQQDNKVMIESCKKSFEMWMSAKGEFAAFVRAYARYKQLDRRFGINIPVGAET